MEDQQDWWMAIGWLTSALDRDHPGYLEEQAERAEVAGFAQVASVLSSWRFPKAS